MLKNSKRGDRKRNPLSDLTNSNSLPSSSVSSSSLGCGAVELPVSELISSRRRDWDERKRNQKKALPISKISNIRNKIIDAEGSKLSEAKKPLAIPCRKKQRVVSSCEGEELQDFIKKQKAYFKEIDEFKLAEEEVGSIDELD